MIRIKQLKLVPQKNEEAKSIKNRIVKKAASLLRISPQDITEIKIDKRSIDARKKDAVLWVYTVDIAVKNEAAVLKKCKDKNIEQYTAKEFNPVFAATGKEKKVVIVGAGPAGLFTAYILALNGFKPILIERGKDVDKRGEDVEQYWKNGILKPDSNVQFGEGGAGTFSDGKLNTAVKDTEGRIDFILKTFVKFGAFEDILYDTKPHVGTDILKDVVRNLRQEIISLGGTVLFEKCMTDIVTENNRAVGIVVNNEEILKADVIVLTIGHSARDTFEMLRQHQIDMIPKDFAVGYRVMHLQEQINEAQYGMSYKDYFGAAPYKLTAKSEDGRGVYSFCMCPGGYVVNSSSEADRICVNGMSYHDRNSGIANSAIVVAVHTEDFKNTLRAERIDFDENNPLIGMYYQRIIERRAFAAGQGKIPVQTYGDYINNRCTDTVDEGRIAIKGQYTEANLRGILPDELENAFIQGMEQMGRKLKGFDATDTYMCGIEGRTSSPVRILRNDSGVASLEGIYPGGEGAGYAGGIMSACIDGIKIAQYIIKGDN